MSIQAPNGELELLERRLRRLEAHFAFAAKRMRKIDSDSPVMPGMDDFNFSEAELAAANPSDGSLEWSPPFLFPNGNSRGLVWDSGSAGDRYVNCSVGYIDTTGELLSFIDASEAEAGPGQSAHRFAKTHFRFYYRNAERSGPLRVTATFSIRKARLSDTAVEANQHGAAIDLLDFQNLRIAAYRQCGDSWERFGKAVDAYHELEWDQQCNNFPGAPRAYDDNRPHKQYCAVLTTQGDLVAGQLTKFYVGIWAGLTLWTSACNYTIFNNFDVKLDKVRAEVI